MQWKEHLKWTDLLLAVLAIALFLFTPLYVSFAIYCILTPFYLWTTRRLDRIKDFGLACALGILITAVFSQQYAYVPDPFGLSLFPLFAWPLGLFGFYILHRHFLPQKYRAVTFVLLYWFLLILFEAGAYHLLGIRNPGTVLYPGLPLCDCIHAPWFMQLAYFFAGPAYLFLIRAREKYFG